MARTQRYRDEHRELLGLAAELEAHLVPSQLLHDAAEARAALSALNGRLALHLGTEDNVLYPELLAHPDERVRAAARLSVEEAADLRAAFAGYVRRWPTSRSIEARPGAFAGETRVALAALSARIRAEDEGVYALADELTPGLGRVVPLRPAPGSGRLRGAG
jgi:hypothetical protein